jgi:hypothetical protein
MVGAAAQQRAIDQGFAPGQDGGEEGADEILDNGWYVGQIARARMEHWWYHSHTNRFLYDGGRDDTHIMPQGAVSLSVRNNYPKLSQVV